MSVEKRLPLKTIIIIKPHLCFRAFEHKDNLLCGLCLLSENRLGLATEALLFAIVPTLAKLVKLSSTLLVLGNLVDGVLLGFWAECTNFLGNIDLYV